MIHIKTKVLGVLIAVLALGIAVPGAAMAEEVAPEAPPAANASPLTGEPCASGHVCSYVGFEWNGGYGESLCTSGRHELNAEKGSVKNRCANKAVELTSFAGGYRGCVNPGGDKSVIQGFGVLYILIEGSRC